MADVYVYIVDLPDRVDEMVTPCIDGGYTVYLNARLTYAGMVRAYYHAMQHIEKNDFEGFDIQDIEMEAHNE